MLFDNKEIPIKSGGHGCMWGNVVDEGVWWWVVSLILKEENVNIIRLRVQVQKSMILLSQHTAVVALNAR